MAEAGDHVGVTEDENVPTYENVDVNSKIFHVGTFGRLWTEKLRPSDFSFQDGDEEAEDAAFALDMGITPQTLREIKEICRFAPQHRNDSFVLSHCFFKIAMGTKARLLLGVLLKKSSFRSSLVSLRICMLVEVASHCNLSFSSPDTLKSGTETVQTEIVPAEPILRTLR